MQWDWSILLRHFTTFVAMFVILWAVAKPHAEAFIQQTVDDRITKVEVQLDKQEQLLWGIIQRLDFIKKEVQ